MMKEYKTLVNMLIEDEIIRKQALSIKFEKFVSEIIIDITNAQRQEFTPQEHMSYQNPKFKARPQRSHRNSVLFRARTGPKFE